MAVPITNPKQNPPIPGIYAYLFLIFVIKLNINYLLNIIIKALHNKNITVAIIP